MQIKGKREALTFHFPLSADVAVEEKQAATETPKTINDCCHPGETFVDLVSGSVCDYKNPAVQVVAKPTAQTDVKGECNQMAVFKVRESSTLAM